MIYLYNATPCNESRDLRVISPLLSINVIPVSHAFVFRVECLISETYQIGRRDNLKSWSPLPHSSEWPPKFVDQPQGPEWPPVTIIDRAPSYKCTCICGQKNTLFLWLKTMHKKWILVLPKGQTKYTVFNKFNKFLQLTSHSTLSDSGLWESISQVPQELNIDCVCGTGEKGATATMM